MDKKSVPLHSRNPHSATKMDSWSHGQLSIIFSIREVALSCTGDWVYRWSQTPFQHCNFKLYSRIPHLLFISLLNTEVLLRGGISFKKRLVLRNSKLNDWLWRFLILIPVKIICVHVLFERFQIFTKFPLNTLDKRYFLFTRPNKKY